MFFRNGCASLILYSRFLFTQLLSMRLGQPIGHDLFGHTGETALPLFLHGLPQLLGTRRLLLRLFPVGRRGYVLGLRGRSGFDRGTEAREGIRLVQLFLHGVLVHVPLHAHGHTHLFARMQHFRHVCASLHVDVVAIIHFLEPACALHVLVGAAVGNQLSGRGIVLGELVHLVDRLVRLLDHVVDGALSGYTGHLPLETGLEIHFGVVYTISGKKS